MECMSMENRGRSCDIVKLLSAHATDYRGYITSFYYNASLNILSTYFYIKNQK